MSLDKIFIVSGSTTGLVSPSCTSTSVQAVKLGALMSNQRWPYGPLPSMAVVGKWSPVGTSARANFLYLSLHIDYDMSVMRHR